jgi:hypothetical protein
MELEGGFDFALMDGAGVGVGISEMGAGNRCAVLKSSAATANNKRALLFNLMS